MVSVKVTGLKQATLRLREALSVTDEDRLIEAAVRIAEVNLRRATPVKTGRLRRSTYRVRHGGRSARVSQWRPYGLWVNRYSKKNAGYLSRAASATRRDIAGLRRGRMPTRRR